MTGGNFTNAALLLTETYKRPVSRQTIANYVDTMPELRRTLNEVDAVFGDLCEHKLAELVNAGNPMMIKFVLSSERHRHRGYSTASTISGPGGGPIPVASALPVDLGSLTEKELAALGTLLARAASD